MMVRQAEMSDFKQEKRLWMQHLESGELESVFNDIQKRLDDDKNGMLSFSLLTGIGNIVSTGKLSYERSDDLYRISRLCFETTKLSNLTGGDKFRFACCLAHVMRFLIDKGNIEPALLLSRFILPLRCTADDSQTCNVLYSAFYMLRELIVRKRYTLSDGESEFLKLLSIYKLSLKFLACCVEKFLKTILDASAKLIKKITLTRDEGSEFVQFAFYILDVITSRDNLRTETTKNVALYESYITFLCEILKCLIKLDRLEEAKIVIEKTLESMHLWITNDALSVIEACTSLLKTVLLTILDQPHNFAHTLPPCTSKLLNLVLIYGNDSYVNWTIISFAWVIQGLSPNWFSLGSEKWKAVFPVEAQKSLCTFVSAISEVLKKSSCVKCISRTGEVCAVKNDTVSSVNILTCVLSCATLSLQYESDGHLMLLSVAHSAVNDSISCLRNLKSVNCPVWKELWRIIATKLYNLGVFCKSSRLLAAAKEFYSKFCWTSIEFEEQIKSFESKNSWLMKGCIRLSELLKELKELRPALEIIAVALIILPDDKDKLLQEWTILKCSSMSCKIDNIHKLTIVDVLEESMPLLKVRCPGIDFTSVDFPQLLLWELESYDSCSYSIPECSQAAFDKLCTLTGISIAMKAQALFLHVPLIWTNCNVTEMSGTISSIKSLMETLKEENDAIKDRLCVLGNLYFWLFMCEHNITRTRQEIEINCTNIIPSTIETLDEDNPDPLGQCDIAPAYKNLNIENESKLLGILDVALTFWCDAVHNDLYFTCVTSNPLPNIEVAAFMYELFGYQVQMLKTWKLYYHYAEKAQNIKGMLRGICPLIEWCSCGEADCKWLAKAHACLQELELKDKEDFESQLLYHKFILAYTTHCFTNKQFTEIPNLLEQLSEFTKKDKLNRFSRSILHVKFSLLLSKCKLLPPPYSVTCPSKEEHYPLNEAVYTFCVSKSLMKQHKMTAVEHGEVYSLILQVSLWLGELYLQLFLPREARCYMKPNLLLCQQMGLVTRTSEFVSLLALVDVMCCNKNDCQVKLQGMETLLQLESSSQCEAVATDELKMDAADEMIPLLKHLNVEEYQNVAQMRANASDKFFRSPQASPNLCREKFNLPSFLDHPQSCQCYMCNVTALQTQTLYTLYIQAEVYSLKLVMKESAEFFHGAIKVYQKLLHKQDKMIKKLNSEINQTILGTDDSKHHLQSLLVPLKIGFIRVAVGYADFMSAGRFYEQASNLNKKADHEMKSLKLYYPLLYADIEDQKFSIQGLQFSAAAPIKESKENYPPEIVPKKLLEATCKTPLNATTLANQNILSPVIKVNEECHFRIKPRKLILSSTKEKETLQHPKVVKTIRKNQRKNVLVYEDSPGSEQHETVQIQKSKLESRCKASGAATAATHKRTRPKRQNNSLSKICQTLDFTSDTPASTRNRKSKNEILNSKVPITKVENKKEENVIDLLQLSSNMDEDDDGDDDVFHPSVFPSKKELPSHKTDHVSKPELKHYRMQKTKSCVEKSGIKCTNSSSSTILQDCLLEKGESVTENNTYIETAQSGIGCRMRRGQKENGLKASVSDTKSKQGKGRRRDCKLSEASPQEEEKIFERKTRQIRGRKKAVISSSSSSGSSESSLPDNLSDAVVKVFEYLYMDTERVPIAKGDLKKKINDGIKGKDFLFTPSGQKKKLDDTVIAPSSPDEDLPKPEIKIIPSSPEAEGSKAQKNIALSEVTPPITRTRAKRGVSTQKKRPLRNKFILN